MKSIEIYYRSSHQHWDNRTKKAPNAVMPLVCLVTGSLYLIVYHSVPTFFKSPETFLWVPGFTALFLTRIRLKPAIAFSFRYLVSIAALAMNALVIFYDPSDLQRLANEISDLNHSGAFRIIESEVSIFIAHICFWFIDLISLVLMRESGGAIHEMDGSRSDPSDPSDDTKSSQ